MRWRFVFPFASDEASFLGRFILAQNGNELSHSYLYLSIYLSIDLSIYIYTYIFI